MKPGIKTTEFYVMICVQVILALLKSFDMIDGDLYASLATATGGGYLASRTAVKLKKESAE